MKTQIRLERSVIIFTISKLDLGHDTEMFSFYFSIFYCFDSFFFIFQQKKSFFKLSRCDLEAELIARNGVYFIRIIKKKKKKRNEEMFSGSINLTSLLIDFHCEWLRHLKLEYSHITAHIGLGSICKIFQV